jgi:hypothetical protein
VITYKGETIQSDEVFDTKPGLYWVHPPEGFLAMSFAYEIQPGDSIVCLRDGLAVNPPLQIQSHGP